MEIGIVEHTPEYIEPHQQNTEYDDEIDFVPESEKGIRKGKVPFVMN
jgi:hypothetical protein